MIKKIFASFIYLSSVSAFAICPAMPPTNDANFCAAFKVVAPCYCASALPPGIPPAVCNNMTVLYSTMMARFGNSLLNACTYQQDRLHYTTTQDCMDNWGCFLNGGVDSRGRVCSSTYAKCA